MFIVITIFGITLIVDQALDLNLFGSDQPLWPMLIFWLFAIIGFWYLPDISPPLEIRISDDNRIEFRGFRKTTVLFPQDIRSLKGHLYIMQGIITLKHSKGDIHLFLPTDNFHEFVIFLKNSNPNIEISGC